MMMKSKKSVFVISIVLFGVFFALNCVLFSVHAQAPSPLSTPTPYICPIETLDATQQVDPEYVRACPLCVPTATVVDPWNIPTFQVPVFGECKENKIKDIEYYRGDIPSGQVVVANDTRFRLSSEAPYFSFYANSLPEGTEIDISLLCDSGVRSGHVVLDANYEGFFEYVGDYVGDVCRLDSFSFMSLREQTLHVGGVELFAQCDNLLGYLKTVPVETPTATPQTSHIYLYQPHTISYVSNTYPSSSTVSLGLSACPAGDQWRGFSFTSGYLKKFTNFGTDNTETSIFGTAVYPVSVWASPDGSWSSTVWLTEKYPGYTPIRVTNSWLTVSASIHTWSAYTVTLENLGSMCWGTHEPELPQPTPMPTLTPTPGYCEGPIPYVDNTPVIGIDPGEWDPENMLETAACFTLIPEFGFDLPAYGNYPVTHVGWSGVEVCPIYVNIPSIELMGISIPMDILILPFALFLIPLIARL